MNSTSKITLAVLLLAMPWLTRAADTDPSQGPEPTPQSTSEPSAMPADVPSGSGGAMSKPDDTRQAQSTTAKIKHEATDSGITTLVKAKLVKNADTHAMNIHVTTKNGIVTLTGEAKSTEEKQDADKAARSVKGVRNVHNKLKVSG